MLSRTQKQGPGRPPSGSVVNGRIKGIGAETQNAILDTAIVVFAQRGYDSVSMREIATLADITPASIYNYYEDKRSLYLAACKHSLGEAARRVAEATNEGTSPRDRLVRYVRALVRVNPNATRLFMRELVEADREGLALLENDSFEGSFRECIELLHEATGEPRSASRAAAVFSLVLGMKQFSNFLEIGGGTELKLHRDLDALADTILQLIAPLSPKPASEATQSVERFISGDRSPAMRRRKARRSLKNDDRASGRVPRGPEKSGE